MLLIAQTPVDVMQSTVKVSGIGEELFYFGMAEGDKLILNFEEVNGKELKEIEIAELPYSSKFMDYKTKKIKNKFLSIPRTAIYQFRFTNGALGGRICKIKIQRVPASPASKPFNTTVYWKTVYDTTYVSRQETFVEKADTVITQLIDQVTKVSSTTAMNGNTNKALVDFTLPEGTVSWSYYIGVGKEGKEAYDKAKDKFISSAVSTVSDLAGFGPMTTLALTGLNTFSKALGSDNVKYYFITDWNNVQLFTSNLEFHQYKQGDVLNDASQMMSPLVGKVYLELLNDNIIDPIDVTVKVVVVQINKKIGTRTVLDQKVTSRQEAYLLN
jgi:hypothetical protein